jgi:hypothetical protein
VTTPARSLLIIERILRDRVGLWRQILDERDLKRLIGQMVTSSTVALAAYGAVLGATGGPLQALASAIKLPVLFLVTLVICLPTLYLFNLVFGSRLSIRQAVALVLVAVTVTGTLSLAFAPVSLFFFITAPNYAFYKILNVAILMLTGIVGLTILMDGMRSLNRLTGEAEAPAVTPATAVQATIAVPATVPATAAPATKETEPAAVPATVTAAAVPATAAPAAQLVAVQAAVGPNGGGPVPGQYAPGHYPPGYPVPGQHMGPYPRPAHQPEPRVNMTLIRIWVLLFGFVGTQLAWTLRPFVGSPDMEFQVFRAIEGNFYVNIIQTIGALF